jgi:hypothetical protein
LASTQSAQLKHERRKLLSPEDALGRQADLTLYERNAAQSRSSKAARMRCRRAPAHLVGSESSGVVRGCFRLRPRTRGPLAAAPACAVRPEKLIEQGRGAALDQLVEQTTERLVRQCIPGDFGGHLLDGEPAA